VDSSSLRAPMTQEATWAADYLSDDPDVSQGPQPWARLVSTNGDYPGCDVHEDDVVIGRRSTCHLHVNHAFVSGEHCKIFRKEGNVAFICDMSRNGTTVNGKLLKKEERLLEDGWEIVLVPARNGNKKISFHIHMTKQKTKLLEGPDLKYKIGDELGSGAFAQVKLAVCRSTGKKFAIKIVDKNKFRLKNHSTRPNALKDEVNILKKLKHENIIGVHEVFENDEKLQIILELVEGGDLFDLIIKYYDSHNRGFDEQKARNIFRQLIAATKYMHDKKVAHRDLKPENILMKDKKSDVVKISDFGLSRTVGEGSCLKTLCGTPMYLAPEVLPGKGGGSQYGMQCDLWSLGAILYVMLSGCSPFDDEDPNVHILDQVKQGKYSFPKENFGHVGENAKDLIRKLLTVDPRKRYTLKQVQEHPWMRERAASPTSKIRKRQRGVGDGGVSKRRK